MLVNVADTLCFYTKKTTVAEKLSSSDPFGKSFSTRLSASESIYCGVYYVITNHRYRTLAQLADNSMFGHVIQPRSALLVTLLRLLLLHANLLR
jgi:hypothetical protein